MGLMILTGLQSALPMWLLLLGAVGLTVNEGREHKLGVIVTMWWVLLVLLTHVIGYLIMRGWVFWRSRQGSSVERRI